MSAAEHRKQLFGLMEDNSLVISYAGHPTLGNEDEYLPFLVNSQFFYLTGCERPEMVLVLVKAGGLEREMIFIEAYNELQQRWTGKRPTAEEIRTQTGIETVMYLEDLDGMLGRFMSRSAIRTVYFDTFRNDIADMPSYNAKKAADFACLYPGVSISDLRYLTGKLRKIKDAEELLCIRKAIAVTDTGLRELLRRLKPGMMEYQAQAVFEGACMYEGAKNLAFPTIAAAGANACSMHYVDNNAELRDGQLILFDLGAKSGNYCSDISRTYPVNGTFTPRQKELYDLVLLANREVAKKAAPGVTMKELNDLTCKVLGEGLIALGMISDVSEVRKYYMHSVSHSLGIDAHDTMIDSMPMEPGWVITDEPGLYIDEEGIGIRIEDDLLITEDGCEVLSEAIVRTTEEIEALMRS